MNEHVDVVVIGSGAGGATVGAELAEAGARVVFLEAGSDLDITYGSPDHFADSQSFLQTIDDGLFWHEQYLGRNWRTDMGECAGGGTTAYAGVLEESTPADYQLWPFSYESFLPYIELTKQRYHVYRWPLKELSHYAKVLAEASDGVLGDIQSGYNREPYFEYGVYHDRCRRCRCCILGCRYNAKANALTIALPKARWFGAELRDNCWVTRLKTNRSGTAVTAVEYLQRTRTGLLTEKVEKRVLTADTVVLAAGSMMTPMLLQWSGRRGRALANSSGQVGKNLRGHFFKATYAVLNRDDIRTYQGNLVELNDQYRNFDKGYLLEFNMVAPPTYMGAMVEVMETADLVKLIGLPFKRLMRQYDKLVISAPLARSFDQGFTDNTVLPHPLRTNRYGDPLPVVTLNPNAQESEWVAAGVEHARQIMINAGADTNQMYAGGLDVVHKVGTCRMGTNSADSVTDLDGKCWELDNLWIADGSLFPAPLLANCAFIIYSLAYKVADAMLGRPSRMQQVVKKHPSVPI
ncbi:MAG: GMC family oxidoreductase [Deltaproteobacteria bacterium]|nr:GMC family oxidoreductase [Deltaproteobacteria bacterium]